MKTLFSRLITVIACFFIFSAAWFCLWSISLHLVERPDMAVLLFPFGLRLGLMLQCPRGYWPVLLGAEWLLIYWLTQAVGLTHFSLLMIGSLLTLLPVALISRYRQRVVECAVADFNWRPDAGPDMSGVLALSRQ